MPFEIDPTQQGGQKLAPVHSARNAAMAEIAVKTNAAIAGDMAAFDEDTGEILDAEQDQQLAEPSVDSSEQVSEVNEQPAPRMVSIVVHGQTLEVPEEKVFEAGRRTLQKETAADKLLQDAAEKQRRAEAMLQRAQQRLSVDVADDDQAPSKDAPQDPRLLFEHVMEQKLYAHDAQKAARTFESEYPDIANDPVLRGYAARLEDERLQHVAAVGAPIGDPVEAYRAHGESVRKWLQERTGTKPAVAQDKQERKRSITAVSAVNARAPAPSEKKPLTTAEIIEQQRVARRQGRQIQPNR